MLRYGVVHQIQCSGAASVGNSTAGDRCLRLFSLSESRMFWEEPSQDWPGSCRGSGLPASESTTCLTKLRERRGRPSLVMFIGDSRARIIFMKLYDTLEHLNKRDIVQDDFKEKPNATFLDHGKRVRCLHVFRNRLSRFSCYMEASSDLVHATFHWTPFLSAGYAERLAVVERDCREGTACPDLIVLTLGMWYAKKTSGCQRLGTMGCPLQLRDELDRLVPVLQTLSQRIQVVYRIDGPDFLDGEGVKSSFNDDILAVTAIVTETLRRKVPQVQLWTSSLAETIRFQHTFCRQLAASQLLLKVKNRHECMDSNHVGDTVRLSAVGAILRYLCRDVERHPAGHCCHQSV
ncbi:uncharacterized protein LOC122370651 isoform X2 [Amphibalanus amphitrite]|uniref:uncharacterized protein LOC122370651 isoform X2 n=1 Tax=Amphibalanus amphitrite TaxID=1232801 RepID=UPI001C8FD7D2|nr:uncharacterized protein LOC122370651 isoform X2 [Amphibalanus amphitrite]